MSKDCSFLGIYMDQTDNFRQQLIAIGTILVVLCLPTITINFLIWITIIAKRHLHHPSYMIIANLALSDWLAGCISFPFYAITCYMNIVGKDTCFIALVSTPISYALGIATFLIVSFQAVERFIAIIYPFNYERCITKFVVMAINLTIWFISCSAVVFWMLSRNTQVFNIFIGVIIFTFSSVNVFCYYKIYVETRKVEKEIANQARLSGEDEINRPKPESKVARVTAAIMINVFVCYSPLLGSSLYGSVQGEKVHESHYFRYWAWLLVSLNSFINPLIACTQLSVIRKAVFIRIRLFGNSVSQV